MARVYVGVFLFLFSVVRVLRAAPGARRDGHSKRAKKFAVVVDRHIYRHVGHHAVIRLDLVALATTDIFARCLHFFHRQFIAVFCRDALPVDR